MLLKRAKRARCIIRRGKSTAVYVYVYVCSLLARACRMWMSRFKRSRTRTQDTHRSWARTYIAVDRTLRVLLNTIHSNSPCAARFALRVARRAKRSARASACACAWRASALQEHSPSLIKEKNTLKMVLERRNIVQGEFCEKNIFFTFLVFFGDFYCLFLLFKMIFGGQNDP